MAEEYAPENGNPPPPCQKKVLLPEEELNEDRQSTEEELTVMTNTKMFKELQKENGCTEVTRF